MSCFSHFGTLLGLAALLSAAGFAQNPAQSRSDSPAPKVAHVEQVLVHAEKGDGALAIEIQTSGARVAPDTQAITGPDRIIVDFPGALPAAALRALQVNQGALKGIRTGLFFNDPPITRVVLDLAEPQSYQISTAGNRTILTLNKVGLNPVTPGSAKSSPVKPDAVQPKTASLSAAAGAAKLDSATFTLGPKPRVIAASSATATDIQVSQAALVPTARLAPAAKLTMAAVVPVAAPRVAPVISVAAAVSAAAVAPLLDPVAEEPAPPKPLVSVTFASGMLSIHAEKASLAQVLFEVQRQTQADIAIPAGAEEEEVIADLGPASARDVLASLLNGSNYNFIFVGSEARLERVILTRRDPNIF
jgi:AMIN domain